MPDTPTFWTYLEQATDPAAYKPHRNEHIVAARLQAGEPYYVLKEPQTRSYLRLSEADYALWWQMDGRRSIKDLLFYSLKRYRTLPIGHLTDLVGDLRQGHFLCDRSVNLYRQIETELSARAPAGRGRRILNGFLHTEMSVGGLDSFFTALYRRLQPLYTRWGQLLILLIILLGGALFSLMFVLGTFSLSAAGGLTVASFIVANLVVIAIHEMAHGLTVKYYGRELDRGGFLIYWGLPAFFVDTRDIWLSPRRARIAVSWAGPHSGLLVGGVVGLVLALVAYTSNALAESLWATFLFQVGFVAYLSVFINLNPLLELDGYFILMDWLDMPGLRRRAFRFWREQLWPRLKVNPSPRRFWMSLRRSERIFTLFGALAFVYSAYALAFALYFWQTRLLPLVESLWRNHGPWGQLLVLLITAAVVVPGLYYLGNFGWNRLQAALEWLARRDLLARPDLLALLVGLPLLAGLPLLLAGLAGLSRGGLFVNLVVWLLHLAAAITLAGVARQLPGSRFQWALWALAATPLAMTLAWLAPAQFWRELSLIVAGATVLAAGTVAWYTVGPRYLSLADRIGMGLMVLAGVAYYAAAIILLPVANPLATALIVGLVFAGLTLMSPLLLNFSRSRFALPWLLQAIAIAALPLLQFYPLLHLPVAALWLYAGLLYLLLGALAQFRRQDQIASDAAAFGERERLVDSFNHFVHAMFAGYEAVFGGRRLLPLQAQMAALGPLDPDATIFEIAGRARQVLLLVVDRLDDLAGTPFTRRAGQAAYDSLPWLEAETLARHVLADTGWGGQLARGFIQAHDRRAALVRQADIFAGFDEDAVQQTLAIARPREARPGTVLAQVDREATHFFLVESGEVGVYHDGLQMATLTAGGYFGLMALRGQGPYLATYRALSRVRLLAIHRDHFDPLLRADTTLASQVRAGARERDLLKRMPLFSSLSPQQLTAVAARLQTRMVEAGEVVVRQGQQRSHLFIVAAGQIEVVRAGAAGAELMGALGPGEHFGEYALFADKPYQATYRAAIKSRLLLLDEPKFDQLVAECERMTHYVEQIGSGRLIATRRRLDLSAILS